MFYSTVSPGVLSLVIGLAVATTSILFYLFKSRKNFVRVCGVKKLIIYPVKALKGIQVDRLEITDSVVKYGQFRDRSWVLLDRDNQFIGLKHEPKLALTKCSFHNDNQLWIEAPNVPTLKLTYIEDLIDCSIITFKLYGKLIKGIDCGEDVHNWFRNYLGKPDIRLLQFHDSFELRETNSNNRRTDDKQFPIIYQNKSGLHLVNESSVADLNSNFPEGSDSASYENFRPNVLVDYPKPWDEDLWKLMSINGIMFLRLLKCDRCPSTNVNQNTGVKSQPTITTLNKLRPPTGTSQKKGLGPSFGVIFGPLSKGFINVNDPIDVVYEEYDVK